MLFVFLLTLAFAKQSLQLREQYNDWKVNNEMVFEDAEDKQRFETWALNWQKVQQHNKEFKQGLHSFRMGMTKWAHMSKLLTDNL